MSVESIGLQCFPKNSFTANDNEWVAGSGATDVVESVYATKLTLSHII